MKKYLTTLSLFLIILIYSVSFSGCSILPNFEFKIESLNDKFSKNPEIYNVLGDNTKLTSKCAGGHLSYDYRGIYFNPTMAIDTVNKKLLFIQFVIVNYDYKYPFGNPFGDIKEIIFITAEQLRIVIKPDLVKHDYTGAIYELYIADILYDDYLKLSNTEALEIKIIGNNNIQTYTKDDVLPSFLLNIKTFNNYTFRLFNKGIQGMTIDEYQNKYNRYIQTYDDGSMVGYDVVQISEEDFAQSACWYIDSNKDLSSDPALVGAEEIKDIKSVYEEHNGI